MKQVKQIKAPAVARKPKVRKKVAAYARISMESQRMHHSLSAQVSYYSDLIQKNPDWQYAGVYVDDGISGTGVDKRAEFNRMMADAEAGKIEIILTKSISRMARNTVDLLNTVRHLKDIGVEVRFEKEHINTFSSDGELMLTLLASFAQSESESISSNVKWSVKKRFEQGIPNGRPDLYGYRWQNKKLVAVPEEAEVVKLIYKNFLNGLSAESTEKELENKGIKSFYGKHLSNSAIRKILTNITYTGNLLLLREYTADPISKKRRINKGELPQYFVADSHEAIIDKATFDKVQAEMARRRELGVFANWSINTTCFTSKIKCGNCGASYRRSGKRQCKDADTVYHVWVCQTYDRKGKSKCDSKCIPEKTLKRICCEVLNMESFNEDIFLQKIDHITMVGKDEMEFFFNDGHTQKVSWQSKARKVCWTETRRAAAGARQMNRNNNPGSGAFTGMIHCPSCSSNFRRQARKYADGSSGDYWHCPNRSGCENKNIVLESLLKKLSCEVLGMDEFDETEFRKRIDHIEILGGDVMKAMFFLRDGRIIKREWAKPKKRGVKHTDEYKDYMRELMIRRWKENGSTSKNGKRGL